MKKFIFLLLLIFISCEKELIEIHNYEFQIDGRTHLDNNGYYHLTIDPIPNQQTLHRFGAYVTMEDKYGIPTMVTWGCDTYWYLEEYGQPFNDIPVPIINFTSYADPLVDSVYCMMAPIGSMIGDTIEIRGKAWFEEGDIILQDSFWIIFN